MFLAYMYTGVELFYVSECIAGYQLEWRENLLSCKSPSNSQLVAVHGLEENGEQADQLPGPAIPLYADVDDLIERVTNAVLQKLQNTQFNDNAVTGNVSLPGTASAVQRSVVAEPVINELSGS